MSESAARLKELSQSHSFQVLILSLHLRKRYITIRPFIEVPVSMIRCPLLREFDLDGH